ncbi:M28 family peptidase [Daejeonella sp.]|jgi:Zn-dependent M28 family amino/carboxypeptidase|uniref:M28 family peptidase n=1 Tax=Daejeonella sp. TaxID=2805397 RepID=UPI0037C176C5
MKKVLLIIALLLGFKSQAQLINRADLLKDIEILASDKYEGRKTGTSGNHAAAEYIIDRFKKIGLNSINEDFKHDFSFKNRKSEQVNGTNLIAYIKGKTEDIIVVSAHYDHVGINNSKIYYGADDNASGVSALLSIAEYFKKHKPQSTIYFIAFDAEEMGLQGAYAFLKDPKTNKKAIKLNINMDMVSHNDKSELYAAGTYKTPVLKEIIKDADKNTGINIIFGHDVPGSGKDDWTMQSDQGPFAKENIPFIYFGVEDHKDYHQATDTFQNINQDFFYAAATAILKSIIKLDKDLQRIK